MVDQDSLTQAINSAIVTTVQRQVEDLFKNDDKLMSLLKTQAVSSLSQRIAKENNIGKIITDKVADYFLQQIMSGAADQVLFDSTTVTDVIANSIPAALDRFMNNLIAKDPTLLGQVKIHAIQTLARNITVDKDVESIIGDKLAQTYKTQFENGAIKIDAKQCELTVMDDNVVVENTLSSRDVIAYGTIAAKDVSVSGDLVVYGSVDPTTGAWDKLSNSIKANVVNDVSILLKSDIVNAILNQADKLNFKQIQLNSQPVLLNDTLGNQIKKSSLTTVGNLETLITDGSVRLSKGTLFVDNKRVGINTIEPNSALDVWDEEVEIVLGKLKQQTAFIGTNRSQGLSLGVNRREDLTIDTNGIVSVQKFKLAGRNISYASKVPNYAGVTGELVINSAMTVDNPIFAWYCLHEYSWVPLKAVI